MSKIAVVTDSNSGITQAQAKACGVTVLPMPFYINEELFYEDINLSQEDFYEMRIFPRPSRRWEMCWICGTAF